MKVLSPSDNHSTNFGIGAFTGTLQLLRDNDIVNVIGGYNSDEAYAWLA